MRASAECNVEAVVTRAAQRKLPLFRHFPEFTRDDLIQEGLLAVSRSKGFDPDQGARSSWIYMVASRRMIDLWRTRTRQADRDARYATLHPGDVVEVIDPGEEPETFEGEVVGSTDTLTLLDWCAATRRNARVTYRDQAWQVRDRRYPVAVVGPLVLLLARLRLGGTAVRWILERRPELVTALGFRHLPSRRMFEDAEALTIELRKTLAEAAREPEPEPEPELEAVGA